MAADLVIAGAGMAGLVAAAEARRLGAAPVVFEKLDRPGGSMLLSSGVVWRHLEFDRFRAECRGEIPSSSGCSSTALTEIWPGSNHSAHRCSPAARAIR